MTNRAPAWLRLLATLFALSLLAAACVSTEDDEGADGETETTNDDDASASEPEEEADPEPVEDEADEPADDEATVEDEAEADDPVELTASWRGVTEDTINIGVSMLDFALLKDMGLSPSGWGDQQAVWQALIDDLNARGGINGRQVSAIYEFYSPIDAADAERACTVMHQDNETFANLGGFVGPAGSADPCIVGTNSTTMVGGEIGSDEELSQANAPWFHSAPTVEFQTFNLLNLLVQTGEADGAVVFTMGGAAAADEEGLVLDALEERGIEVVGSAIIEA
ncbi:MAG: hypothetical protein AAGC53_10635, partial [Actinomycetota bacterium]